MSTSSSPSSSSATYCNCCENIKRSCNDCDERHCKNCAENCRAIRMCPHCPTQICKSCGEGCNTHCAPGFPEKCGKCCGAHCSDCAECCSSCQDCKNHCESCLDCSKCEHCCAEKACANCESCCKPCCSRKGCARCLGNLCGCLTEDCVQCLSCQGDRCPQCLKCECRGLGDCLDCLCCPHFNECCPNCSRACPLVSCIDDCLRCHKCCGCLNIKDDLKHICGAIPLAAYALTVAFFHILSSGAEALYTEFGGEGWRQLAKDLAPQSYAIARTENATDSTNIGMSIPKLILVILIGVKLIVGLIGAFSIYCRNATGVKLAQRGYWVVVLASVAFLVSLWGKWVEEIIKNGTNSNAELPTMTEGIYSIALFVILILFSYITESAFSSLYRVLRAGGSGFEKKNYRDLDGRRLLSNEAGEDHHHNDGYDADDDDDDERDMV